MADAETNNQAVSRFSQLSVEELEALIRLYAEKDDEESLQNMMLAADELTRKKKEQGFSVDVDAYWERFQRDYLPLLEDDAEGSSRLEGDNFRSVISSKTFAAKQYPGKPGIARRVIARTYHVVAAAVLIVLVLGMTACAAIPSVRASVVNFVVKTFGNHSVVSLEAEDQETHGTAVVESDSGTTTYELGDFTFEIPSRFMPGTVIADNEKTYYSCELYDDDSEIYVHIYSQNSIFSSVDTEDSNAEYLMIQGCEGIIVQKDNYIQISWAIPPSEEIIILTVQNLDKDTSIQIANSFVFMNNS